MVLPQRPVQHRDALRRREVRALLLPRHQLPPRAPHEPQPGYAPHAVTASLIAEQHAGNGGGVGEAEPAGEDEVIVVEIGLVPLPKVLDLDGQAVVVEPGVDALRRGVSRIEHDRVADHVM